MSKDKVEGITVLEKKSKAAIVDGQTDIQRTPTWFHKLSIALQAELKIDDRLKTKWALHDITYIIILLAAFMASTSR